MHAPRTVAARLCQRIVEMAAKRKMSVILCTPTAVVPVWMVQKYPEVMLTGKRFGGRRHALHLHPRVQDFTRKVVTQLADRLGNLPDRRRRIALAVEDEDGGIQEAVPDEFDVVGGCHG